jgi:hypothetical protein
LLHFRSKRPSDTANAAITGDMDAAVAEAVEQQRRGAAAHAAAGNTGRAARSRPQLPPGPALATAAADSRHAAVSRHGSSAAPTAGAAAADAQLPHMAVVPELAAPGGADGVHSSQLGSVAAGLRNAAAPLLSVFQQAGSQALAAASRVASIGLGGSSSGLANASHEGSSLHIAADDNSAAAELLPLPQTAQFNLGILTEDDITAATGLTAAAEPLPPSMGLSTHSSEQGGAALEGGPAAAGALPIAHAAAAAVAAGLAGASLPSSSSGRTVGEAVVM